MSFRYGRGALRPTHDYVCFSCHLQRHRITDSQHRRYQHVEASPTRSNADGVPLQIQSTNTQEGEGLKPKGKAASLETDSTTDGSSTPRKGGSKSKVCSPLDFGLKGYEYFNAFTSGLKLTGCSKTPQSKPYRKVKPIN